MRNKILALSGKIGSGKDTLKDFIEEECKKRGIKTQRLFFAEKLKQVSEILTGYGGYTQEEKNIYLPEYGFTVGEGLQKIGDGLRNIFHIDVWINTAFRDADEDSIKIITDCRYPSEVEYLRSKGAYIIRLIGDPANVRANTKRNINHMSEIALDNFTDFDLVFKNDEGIECLKALAEKIIEENFVPQSV